MSHSEPARPTPPPARLRLDDPVRPNKAGESTAAWGERAASDNDLADFYRQATPPHHGQV